MTGHARVGSYTTVRIGDVANLQMHTHGCEDPGCDCGGAEMAVVMGQVDGTGAMVVLPLRAWAFVAAAVNSAIIEGHPEMVMAALRTIESNTHSEPEPKPEITSRWVDAIPFLQEEVPPPQPPEEVIEQALAMYGEVLVGAWVRLMGKGKVHCIGSLVTAPDKMSILIKSLCGREADGWTKPDLDATLEHEVCVTCSRKYGVIHSLR